MDFFTIRHLRQRTGEFVENAKQGKLAVVAKHGRLLAGETWRGGLTGWLVELPPLERRWSTLNEKTTSQELVFFLGGRDLEMITIRDIARATGHQVYDKELTWGTADAPF